MKLGKLTQEEIVAKWEAVGLLEDVDKSLKVTAANIYELGAEIILRDEIFGNAVGTMAFPMLKSLVTQMKGAFVCSEASVSDFIYYLEDCVVNTKIKRYIHNLDVDAELMKFYVNLYVKEQLEKIKKIN